MFAQSSTVHHVKWSKDTSEHKRFSLHRNDKHNKKTAFQNDTAANVLTYNEHPLFTQSNWTVTFNK